MLLSYTFFSGPYGHSLGYSYLSYSKAFDQTGPGSDWSLM
jgi:hypothetical protein